MHRTKSKVFNICRIDDDITVLDTNNEIVDFEKNKELKDAVNYIISHKENNLDELSPLVRNAAAAAAADKVSSTDSNLTRTKALNQHRTFTQLPRELQSKGKELAKRISDFVGASEYTQVLKKVVHETSTGMSPYIHYRVEMVKKDEHNRPRQVSFAINIEKDKIDEFQNNVTLPNELSRAILAFAKKLQIEMQ